MRFIFFKNNRFSSKRNSSKFLKHFFKHFIKGVSVRGRSRRVAKFLLESNTFHIKSKAIKMLSCKNFTTLLVSPLYLWLWTHYTGKLFRTVRKTYQISNWHILDRADIERRTLLNSDICSFVAFQIKGVDISWDIRACRGGWIRILRKFFWTIKSTAKSGFYIPCTNSSRHFNFFSTFFFL